MKNKTIISQEQGFDPDEIFKATALLYFGQALLAQEFESCQGLIGAAKTYGASQEQIEEVIAAYLRGDKKGEQNEAKQIKNRLLFLKEKK